MKLWAKLRQPIVLTWPVELFSLLFPLKCYYSGSGLLLLFKQSIIMHTLSMDNQKQKYYLLSLCIKQMIFCYVFLNIPYSLLIFISTMLVKNLFNRGSRKYIERFFFLLLFEKYIFIFFLNLILSI